MVLTGEVRVGELHQKVRVTTNGCEFTHSRTLSLDDQRKVSCSSLEKS